MAIDAIINAIDTKLDREVHLFNLEIEKILAEASTLIAAEATHSISDPLTFDFKVQKILQEVGYYELINKYVDESYDKSYSEILALFKEGGLDVVFTEADLAIIKNIKELEIQAFIDIGNNAAQQLKRDLYKYSLSDMNKKDIITNISNSLAGTDLAKHSTTYANTAISNYNQSIIDIKSAGVTGEVYIYRGVTDKKTRKFCSCVVKQKKYYDKSDANSLRNDKRRQWNCRHVIVAVSKEWAEARGFEAGDFTC